MVRKKIIKIKTKREIGFRISDIGPGGKEFNIRESKNFKKLRSKKIL